MFDMTDWAVQNVSWELRFCEIGKWANCGCHINDILNGC